MLAIIIILIIAIPFVLALFTPDEFSISAQTTISKPVQEVFNYVKYLKNSEHYNKWVMTDPDMKKELRGTDGSPGFVYAWDSTSKQVGKGEQQIVNIQEGRTVDYEIRFEKPFKSTSYAQIKTEAADSGSTRVTYTFRGVRNYMMKLLHVVMNLKKVLARDMAESMTNLKTLLEK